MTTSALNTKISEVRNKIPNVVGLVKKTDYDTKIKDNKGKYFTIANYSKLTSDIFEAKIKQKKCQ